MGKQFLFGVLVLFAAFGAAVAAIMGHEWWQDRNLVGQAVVAPAEVGASSGPARSEPQEAVSQAPEPTVATTLRPEAPVETISEAPREPVGAAPTTTLHPQVQAQGLERVVAIVEGHSDAWPWIVSALDVAQLSFFEDLPAECASAIGCYNHTTGDIWLSLDALREPDTGSYSSFFDRRGPSDIVLHELAHAYTRSFRQGSELLDLFGQHYAGCSVQGLDTTRSSAELLADTMAMVVTSAGSSLPADYGYFGSGGFAGCLTESGQPDTALVGAVYSTLFNCDSVHALNAYANYRDPMHVGPLFGRDFDADAVLLACYGIDCTAAAAIDFGLGCTHVTETDERRDAAEDRLHQRRCADGLLWEGNWVLERPGWEFGCEDFVPADVECLVTDPGQGHEPGLLDVTGQCIVPDCTVDGAQGEPQPGHRSMTWECVPIQRPVSEDSD